MKVMAFVGSPRKDGNTVKIVNAVCKGARESGHEVETYNLSELKNEGCLSCDACQNGKTEYCAIEDKLSELLPKIAEADCLIVGTPVYMLQVSGVTKNFLDRLRPFLKPDLTSKQLPGKKYITVTCSGAPAEAFRNVAEYLDQLFEYFSMKKAGNIIAGKLKEKDDIFQQSRLLEQAEAMGKELN